MEESVERPAEEPVAGSVEELVAELVRPPGSLPPDPGIHPNGRIRMAALPRRAEAEARIPVRVGRRGQGKEVP